MEAMALEGRDRLAKYVRERRLELGLAIKRAAAQAGMSKDTWTRIERGETVRGMSYAKVDTTLGWAVGSCEAILRGSEPLPTRPSQDSPGVAITERPTEDLDERAREAIQVAVLATTDDLTAEKIRDLSDRAVHLLKERGII